MSMGRTIRIEYRNADAASGRLDDDAPELVRLKVDVIVAAPSPAIAAAKKATTRLMSALTSKAGIAPRTWPHLIAG
jgi:hypothetical protein